MTDYFNTTTSSEHYVGGRTIEPIEVIESWSLCYHLACVVKCIESAGRKNTILEDLKKAEWYLMREITRYQEFGEVCHLPLSATNSLLTRRICEDWQLSGPLSKILDNIRASKISSLRLSSLMDALKFLMEEIQHHEFLKSRE